MVLDLPLVFVGQSFLLRLSGDLELVGSGRINPVLTDHDGIGAAQAQGVRARVTTTQAVVEHHLIVLIDNFPIDLVST